MKINPADLAITPAQMEAFDYLKSRHEAGKITRRSDVQKALGGKEKSWVSRILQALVKKGLVERYERQYYKLATKGK